MRHLLQHVMKPKNVSDERRGCRGKQQHIMEDLGARPRSLVFIERALGVTKEFSNRDKTGLDLTPGFTIS